MASIIVSGMEKEIAATLSKAGISVTDILIISTPGLAVTVTVPVKDETIAKTVTSNLDWLLKMKGKYGQVFSIAVKTR